MALALIEETFQFAFDADTADGDALRAPGIAIVGSEHLGSTKHGIEVVHRLSLSHKHDIRQGIALRQGIYLIEYVGSRQTALIPLFTRLAEEAVHLTTDLTGHTQSGPLAYTVVAVGTRPLRDIDSLHEFLRRLARGCTPNGKKVLDSPVNRALTVDGIHSPNDETSSQQLTIRL